jgi:HEPN domain-containing protein
MKRSTGEWVRKAESDYQLARAIASGKKRFHDEQSFHCQQAAEKYLKALLEELSLSVKKTHELEELLDQLLPYHISLRVLRRGLAFLSQFAVEVRYPGDNATKRQATSALRWAGKVRQACRTILGLPTPRRGSP